MAIPKIIPSKFVPDEVMLKAAFETEAKGTKLFVVEGIDEIESCCTCGKKVKDCKSKSGKLQAGKHPITDGSRSPYPLVERTNKKGDKYKTPSWPLQRLH
jgi:hypothetical protein